MNQENERDWPKAIVRAQVNANLSIHRKHGSTPFAVYYGRTHNLFNTDEGKRTMSTWVDHIKHFDDFVIPALNSRMNRYYDQQEESFLKANEQRLTNFGPGDLVKVKANATDKLEYQWIGPYAILERVDGGYNVVNALSNDKAVANKNPIPAHQITPWTSKSLVTTTMMDEWYITNIIKHRVKGNKTEYLVQWEGNWSPTWVPGNQTSRAAIDAYNKRIRKKSLALIKRSSSTDRVSN
jgi:hypothetical protein